MFVSVIRGFLAGGVLSCFAFGGLLAWFRLLPEHCSCPFARFKTFSLLLAFRGRNEWCLSDGRKPLSIDKLMIAPETLGHP